MATCGAPVRCASRSVCPRHGSPAAANASLLIGAVAIAAAAEGASVVVNDYGVKVDGTQPDSGPAAEVVEEIRKAGGKAVPNFDTVATVEGGENLIKTALDSFGRLDILVNVAGIYFPKASVVDLSEEDWDRTIDINVGSNFFCCREFVPSMRAQKSGRIISLASGIGHYGMRQFSHYAASKAAVMGFVKALAREVGPDGITVNAICPGSANTSMPRQHRSEEEVMARLRSTPLPRVLEPEDIAGPILFLASDAAAYITGQSYDINCGSYMF